MSCLPGLQRSAKGSYPCQLFPDRNLHVSSEYARRDRKRKEDPLDLEVSPGEYDGFRTRGINNSLGSCLELCPPFS